MGFQVTIFLSPIVLTMEEPKKEKDKKQKLNFRALEW